MTAALLATSQRRLLLVPKHCLGTPRCETLFRVRRAKRGFEELRTQTEFGNENDRDLRMGSE
jgi:hypothetical protein